MRRAGSRCWSRCWESRCWESSSWTRRGLDQPFWQLLPDSAGRNQRPSLQPALLQKDVCKPGAAFMTNKRTVYFFKLVPKNQQLFERQDVNSGAPGRADLIASFVNSSFPKPCYNSPKATVPSWSCRFVGGVFPSLWDAVACWASLPKTLALKQLALNTSNTLSWRGSSKHSVISHMV